MSDHPNAVIVREGFDHFVRGDVAGLVGLFADDAVWHVPGANDMAGDYRGRDAIIAFLRRTAELTGGDVLSRRAAVGSSPTTSTPSPSTAPRASATAGERSTSSRLCWSSCEDGLWTDIRAQPLDQPAFGRVLGAGMQRFPGIDSQPQSSGMLVQEQAALNRVAVTVATETAAERVFDVVTEEVAASSARMRQTSWRFSRTFDEGLIVGKWSEPGVQIPGAGTVVAIADGSALSRVARTGAPRGWPPTTPRCPRSSTNG